MAARVSTQAVEIPRDHWTARRDVKACHEDLSSVAGDASGSTGVARDRLLGIWSGGSFVEPRNLEVLRGKRLILTRKSETRCQRVLGILRMRMITPEYSYQ